MAFRRTTIGLLFILVALIALVVFLALIMPMPAVAQSILKTKTRVEVADPAAIFGEPVTLLDGVGRCSSTISERSKGVLFEQENSHV